MKLGWEIIYSAIFLEALIVSLLLTPLTMKLGFKWGLVDMPGGRKIHQEPRARSGGVAIFLSFLIVLLLNLILANALGVKAGLFKTHIDTLIKNINLIMAQLGAILIGAVIVFFLGIMDDKHHLRPTTKLLFQVIATLPLLIVGIKIVFFLPAVFGSVLTVLWVVLLINSFNFLDNTDGLCAGVAFIVLMVLAYISLLSREYFMIAIFLVLGGSILGFWRYNFYPARLFMGDGGSLFIGYMIGALTVLATYYRGDVPTRLPVLTPLIVLGVPIFDTVSVILIRLKNRAPLMVGDTNHFSHRLISLGMSQPGAVIFIYLLTLCVALNALPLHYLSTPGSLVQTFQICLLFVLIYILERTGKQRGREH